MADSWMYQPSMGPVTEISIKPRRLSPSGLQQTNVSALNAEHHPADKHNGQHRIRRRNRVITSCLECRRRKLKCDKTVPCSNCTRFKRDCLYLAPALDPHSQQKLSEIKEKMGALEKNLEKEVQSAAFMQGHKPHVSGTDIAKLSFVSGGETSWTHIEADDAENSGGRSGGEEDEEALEPTPLAALDNVYEDGGDDELMDLGVQMGKMRISERVGGWIRPKLVDELNDTLKDVTGGKSWFSTGPTMTDHRAVGSGGGVVRLQASPKSYIGPGPDYIAPASSFFFPGTNRSIGLMDYLPSRSAADRLIEQYFRAVHYMCRAVHRPTFEAQYTLFWSQMATGSEPTPGIQAIMFAAMFSAVVSLSEAEVTRGFGTTRAALVDSLRSGTEFALAKANFLRTTRVDVMQAFVMYLIALVRAEVSRAHSALVGTAIRLAECMGLHRDGMQYSMTPVEVHVRRLLWHQLCFLDYRTCEATGPRPQIRPGDYDTKHPLNVDDADLLLENPPTEDRPYWTDMTLMRLRTESIELRQSLWFDMVQVDRKKKSLTSTVVKIQKAWNHLTARYFPMMDPNNPFHTLGRHILTLGVQGCFVSVLHRYLFSTAQRMPDRLRQILIEAGLTQMENAIALETNPDLAPWAWYRGAFNQYHSALLLMVEVYAYPMRKDAPRIWKCLDYIFDIPSHLSPKQKAELVITDLRDRMEVYHQMRRVKVTKQMEERVGALNKSGLHAVEEYERKVAEGLAVGEDAVLFLAGGGDMSSTMPPVNFSPPPPKMGSSSVSSGQGRQQSVVKDFGAGTAGGAGGGAGGAAVVPAGGGGAGEDMTMMMDDIDWAEWDRYFPIEQNTGDLNIPDFDFNNFTTGGGYDAAGGTGGNVGTSVAGNLGGGAGAVLTGTADMTDIDFTPALLPHAAYHQVARSGQGDGGRNGGWGASYQ
ncbi:bikaverin cluster transcription factor bik5-like [Teratosphaeria destructans]|uniref:Bikaverin cluster transcription factor bik5-like n=1 Tax=Teratosphaeria destructans TaxID=418781 RepID=A0A9W7SU25_9PEZI|nr:bikaverin cluster transcription factor bik5-like [Teratosphaeria destructans]